jgi:hypothetical protein
MCCRACRAGRELNAFLDSLDRERPVGLEKMMNQRRKARALMVPTARLELAQLSPLPPQDSVSTNFTTSAFNVVLNSQRL